MANDNYAYPRGIPRVVIGQVQDVFQRAATEARGSITDDWSLREVRVARSYRREFYDASISFACLRSWHFSIDDLELYREGCEDFFSPRYAGWFEIFCRHLWEDRYRPDSLEGMRRQALETIANAERVVRDHGALAQLRREITQGFDRMRWEARYSMRAPVFPQVTWDLGATPDRTVLAHTRDMTATEVSERVRSNASRLQSYVDDAIRRMRESVIDGWVSPGSWVTRGREDAEKKAEALLRENLSKAQLAQYDQHGYFEVRGGDTGVKYRITRGSTFNVLYRKYGRWNPMCFIPVDASATGDVMLSQKITLELDEQTALRVANYR